MAVRATAVGALLAVVDAAAVSAPAVPTVTASAWANADGTCTLKSGLLTGAHAQATWQAGNNVTGWGVLYLNGSEDPSVDPRAIAFAAGCLEGSLTQQQIFDYWSNYAAVEYGAAGPSASLLSFMSNQKAFVEWQSEAHSHRAGSRAGSLEDRFWGGMSLLLSQFEGLVAGYTSAAPSGSPQYLDALTLYLLNSVGDLEDLNTLFPNTGSKGVRALGGTAAARARLHAARTGQAPSAVLARASLGFNPIPVADKLTDCSGLVRVLPDGSDVVLAHTTWRAYYAMLRVHKVVAFPTFTAAGRVVMSSSPGLLSSKDDFYASPFLAVGETTNSVYNETLYQLYTTEQTALCWQRSMIAMWAATSGQEWTDLFAMYNSGTYNNQWLVVDASKFNPAPASGRALRASRHDAKAKATRTAARPADSATAGLPFAGATIAPGLLWILEQIPGTTQAADMTPLLVSQGGYWPSYNIPFFEGIYNASGYPAMAAKYGPQYTYANCSRSQIFARNFTAVTDIASARALARYNNFAVDPLAQNDPILGSISSRGDLRPTTPVPFGGVDTKVISVAQALLARNSAGQAPLDVYTENGPTHDQQPVFQWSAFPAFAGVPRAGLPDAFNFSTVLIPGVAPVA